MNINNSNNPKVKAQIEQIDNQIDKLIEAVDEVKASEEFNAWLKMIGKFHKYSWNNIFLIWCQRPEATKVAGFRKWKDEFGRNVKKGEKGISILVPYFKKIMKNDDDGEREVNALTGFGVGYVFDVEQTEGKELPECPNRHIGGNEYEAHYVKLQDIATRMGIAVDEKALPNGTGGVSKHGAITISSNNDATDKAHIMAHEIAHEILHWNDKKHNREMEEMEAEAVAYVVSINYGIDCTYHSASYLAAWKANKEGMKESLERIKNTATMIIEAIEKPEQVKPLKKAA
jgi:hypothetical protein